MAKPVARLKLFLSSTSELTTERGLIGEIVADVNRVIEEHCAATIRIIDWRKDVVPGVGSDPQQVINSQTTDYDIYVGILATRFGTPTQRAGSGTEDEFNIAYARFRTNPKSVRLLFYFRSGLTGNLSDIEAGEVRRVQSFRTRLGAEKGVLFCDYSSPVELADLFRAHLIQLLSTQWNESGWKPMPELEPAEPQDIARLVEAPTGPGGEEDKLELLDLRVDVDDAFQAAMGALAKVSESMNRGAEADRQWKLGVDKVMALGVPAARKAQELVNDKAKDFEQRARELRPLTAAYRSATADFFDKIATLLEMQIQMGTASREEILAGIDRFREADTAARAVRDVYDQIAKGAASLPAPTREFKRQQRSLTSQIEQFSAAVASWLDRSASLRARFGGPTADSSFSGEGKMGVYFRCKNCGKEHLSPIGFGSEKTFDSTTLIDNLLQCPTTHKMASYDKKDMFWKDETQH